jgi:hypothetical protein
MKASYKVAVWATGGVGKYAIRTIADRPNLELAGVWVHSDGKHGKDAGELAGIETLGIHATRDESEILGGDADCVVYAAPAPPRMKEAIGDGGPSFDAEFEVGYRSGENHSNQGLLATGMRAVNAIPWVCDAEPGIVDALHIPLTSPVGALHPHRDGIPAF